MSDASEGAAVQVPDLDESGRDFLKALASETRQQVMALFAGGVQLSVGEVAERAGLGPSTASEHLSLLKRGGLLVSVREGKTVRYRADATMIAARLDGLKAYLTLCCPPSDCSNSGCS
ncbi:metalloregulator ArsR/SmtB family transcription factor [Yinghuangia sp. ASG 101]|uniref:ArsR/SmtB family transcription factor n=1 Tax=Yinghuangia sp. ASG 101 TaxID=2896848 RepID=UPI001E63BF4C|nr:metalloregulator ArsR/SmtB family transcription factor [Yinghuangia sp. ASG 101]UGQ10466.1 metalloregulator ArsR/SmtB family transcription factor [Yinghuangia sp. ASG 101]